MTLSLIARVVARFKTAAVLTVFDLEDLQPDERAHWKGYTFTMLTEVFSKEEVEEDADEAANTKQEKGETFLSLDKLLAQVKADTWTKWIERGGFIDGKPKKGRKGEVTRKTLLIEHKDGKPLDYEEVQDITRELRLKS